MPINNTGFIYIVRSKEQSAAKIGFGAEAQRRLEQLRTGNPCRLTLWDYFPASKQSERTVQTHFASTRIVREWFNIELVKGLSELSMFIDDMADEFAELWEEEKFLDGPEPLFSDEHVKEVLSQTRKRWDWWKNTGQFDEAV